MCRSVSKLNRDVHFNASCPADPHLVSLRRSSREEAHRNRTPGPVRSEEPRDRMGGTILPSGKEKNDECLSPRIPKRT